MRDDATAGALRRYIEHGSDLTRPMTMDFFVAVPSEAAAHRVAGRASALGFIAKVYESKECSGGWTCNCEKTIVPSYENVMATERQLDAIGREFGGHADGFGSFGNAPEKD